MKIPVFVLNKSSPSWERAVWGGEHSSFVDRSRLEWMVLGACGGACQEAMGNAPLDGSTWDFGGSCVEKSLPSAPGPGVPAVAWRGASLSRGTAGISSSPGAEDQGYPTRTGTVGNPRSCADCVKCTPFPRAYRHSYKRSKDGRNDIPLLIIVWSHLYIWCYVTDSSLLLF